MLRYLAIPAAILGLVQLSHSSDFWRQLRTLGWIPVQVTVVSHVLEPKSMGYADAGTFGQIRFQASGASSGQVWTDEVFQRFDYDRGASRTKAYIDALAPGTVHTAYQSPDGTQASFGHFPRSYGWGFALSGFAWLAFAVAVWVMGGKRKERHSTADVEP